MTGSALDRQIRAADPRTSSWVSANAGSGKTRVLTDRVARLLLRGVLPQRILCLTYTKAAAGEMQNRLFKRLGAWAMADDKALAKNLTDLGENEAHSADTLREARRLFARAIETPGGLKIQTIHSFCGTILRRFPLEAGVSPLFTEIDEQTSRTLREEIAEAIANDLPAVFDALARHFTGDSLDDLTGEIARKSAAVDPGIGDDEIWSALGLQPGADESRALETAFTGGEQAFLAELVPELSKLTKTYAEFGQTLARINPASPGFDDLAVLYDLFLYKSGARRGQSKSANWPQSNHKAAREALAPWLDEMHAFMDRVADARQAQLQLLAAHRTAALHKFASAFLDRFAENKQSRGWLDFDDLIEKTRDLLVRPGVAEWVLYRLDGGIDHILVDEAQDTSPIQWEVIDLLAQEFTSGQGSRSDDRRTMFVVGDKKQSIYSFQGADPDGFDRMEARVADRLAHSSEKLQSRQLQYSFRSSPAILRAVDGTFAANPVGGMGQSVGHLAFNGDMPGRVDLWPPVEKATAAEPADWKLPTDILASDHHHVVSARRIAAQVKNMIATQTLQGGEGKRRNVTAGDILILVRRRSELFHQIIAALKEADIPVAGADRLKVGGELAVKDVLAVLQFLATPEDDLSLACALKSPLLGWDEDRLFKLAAPRGSSFLWQSFRAREDLHDTAYDILSDLRREADFLRPFELIDRLLTRHSGRKNLIARLGKEAEDGIDALIDQALAYERAAVPSLTGFLSWVSRSELEIKRQLDSAGGRIRVMTVHGSKGLEAPIVILPETGAQAAAEGRSDSVQISPGNIAIWKPQADEMPDAVRALTDAQIAKQAAERNRLLYVAMTRAEQWLIVSASGETGSDDSWYNLIDAGLAHCGAVEHAFSFGPGKRFETGDWPDAPPHAPPKSDDAKPGLPEWALTPAPVVPRPTPPITPSGLGGPKTLPGEHLTEKDVLALGTALHRLLEHLPNHSPQDWPSVGRALLPDLADELPELLQDARRLIESDHLKFLFGPGSRAEQDISADIAQPPYRVHGAIDRLVISRESVLAVDYKTNRVIPADPQQVPDGLLRQMGAYQAALERVFPDRRVGTAILWTQAATLMHLPPDLVLARFANALS